MSYLTLAEAATRLGISRQAVLKATKSGRLPSTPQVERGRVVRHLVRSADVEQLIHGSTRPPGALSIDEAALYLSVGSSTISRWIDDGHLRSTTSVTGVVSLTTKDLDAVDRPVLRRRAEAQS